MKKNRMWPLYVYSFMMIPLSCIQHWIFLCIPNYYMQHVLIYPSLLFMAWSWWAGLWKKSEIIDQVIKLSPFIFLLFLLQSIAMWRSAELYPNNNVSTLISVISGLGKLAAQLPFLLFFYFICKIIIINERARKYLIQGALVAFFAIAVICSIQGVYIYTMDNNAYIAKYIHSHAKNILIWISPWAEARWINPVYDFYKDGGYTLTGSQPRINGVFEEASMLSVWLGTFFLPLGIGLMGAYDGKRKKILYIGLCVVSMSLLFLILCRLTTGQLLAFVGMTVIIWYGAMSSYRILFTPVIILICSTLIYIAFTGPHIQTYFLDKFKYADAEVMPRVVITKDTLDIIFEHPLLGTGRGWYYPYIYEGKRFHHAISRDLELQTWKHIGKGGQISELPALTAQFGIPIVLFMFYVTGKMWLNIYILKREYTLPWIRGAYQACTAWILLGLVASFGILDMRNPLFCLPFFCFYALSQGFGVKNAVKE